MQLVFITSCNKYHKFEKWTYILLKGVCITNWDRIKTTWTSLHQSRCISNKTYTRPWYLLDLYLYRSTYLASLTQMSGKCHMRSTKEINLVLQQSINSVCSILVRHCMTSFRKKPVYYWIETGKKLYKWVHKRMT